MLGHWGGTFPARIRARAAGSVCLVVAVAAATGCGGTAGSAAKQTGGGGADKKLTIAFSNSFIGNSFRLEMQNMWKVAMTQEPYRSEVKGPIVNSNNNINQERQQLNSLISQKVDAIVIDAGSSTALNGIIQQATSRGITVVSYDNVVTAPSALKIQADNLAWGRTMAQDIVKRINGKGDVLMVTGVPGAPQDALRNKGGEDVFKRYPNIKVHRVVGQWDSSVAQRNVASALPSLPTIKGAWVSAGTDGVVRAFQHHGGPMPVFAGEAENGYRKALAGVKGYPAVKGVSVTEPTYMILVALELARQVVTHKTQPRNINLPLQVVTSENIKVGEHVFPNVPDSFADGITDTGPNPVVKLCVEAALKAQPCPGSGGRLTVTLPK